MNPHLPTFLSMSTLFLIFCICKKGCLRIKIQPLSSLAFFLGEKNRSSAEETGKISHTSIVLTTRPWILRLFPCATNCISFFGTQPTIGFMQIFGHIWSIFQREDSRASIYFLKDSLWQSIWDWDQTKEVWRHGGLGNCLNLGPKCW